jgi:hypothetical protein
MPIFFSPIVVYCAHRAFVGRARTGRRHRKQADAFFLHAPQSNVKSADVPVRNAPCLPVHVQAMHGRIATPGGFSPAPVCPDALSLYVERGKHRRFFYPDMPRRCRATSVRTVLYFSAYRPIPYFLMRTRIGNAPDDASSMSGAPPAKLNFQPLVRAERNCSVRHEVCSI